MLAHAAATTAVLGAASVASKLFETQEVSAASTRRAAEELLHQSLHWRDVALQDADPALRLQHAAAAATLLQAARTVACDADLERASGMDVARLARALEANVADARQIVRPA
jgi:hypothetical protein